MSTVLPAEHQVALQNRAYEALVHWGISDGTPQLLKYRENAVFKVLLTDGRPAVLRLHRPGYHDAAALGSELQFMAHLKNTGLSVPEPIACQAGSAIVQLPPVGEFDPQYVDMLTWLDGSQLGETGVPFQYSEDRVVQIFSMLGATMAEMHLAADTWTPPVGFSRPSWDLDGLIGQNPLWGRFWDHPRLEKSDQKILSAIRQELSADFIETGTLDYGLIHGDLVRENVLVTQNGIQLLDFDDFGYGFRLFEIATSLLRNRNEPHYGLIKESLLTSYCALRPVLASQIRHLPMFMLLRSLTYIGWALQRGHDIGNAGRLERYIRTSKELFLEYQTA